MFLDRKPFHLKNKFFYQTKINLWGKDLKKFKVSFRKKKWNFVRFRARKPIDTFRFSPFLNNPRKNSIRFNYKNILFLRKLIRLKYGRLKNKELQKIFRGSNGYESFILNLGSRLDVILGHFLAPISIFFLRQSILHGRVLVNGVPVKSPGFRIKNFDVISFSLLDLSNNKFFYKDIKREMPFYFRSVGKGLYFFCLYYSFSDNIKKALAKDLLMALYRKVDRKSSTIVDNLVGYLFKKLEATHERRFIKKNRGKLKYSGATRVSVLNLVKILQNYFIIVKLRRFLKKKKRDFFIQKDINLSLRKNNLDNLFDSNFFYENCEIFFYKDFVDITYFGDRDSHKINTNYQKYILHYLYK